MPDFVFYRAAYSTMFVDLGANEELGLLDTDYVEDHAGVDGQITLYHRATDTRYTFPVVAVPGQTPGIPNDYFRAAVTLAGIPDGVFAIEGRVRDLVGNETLLVEAPVGPPHQIIEIEVKSGFATITVVARRVGRIVQPRTEGPIELPRRIGRIHGSLRG